MTTLMRRRYAVAGEAYKVPLGEISPHPDNPRKLTPDDAWLQELAGLLKAQGQREAALVAPTPPELVARGVATPLVIVYGHCRWYSCGMAGIPTLDTKIEELTALQILLKQVAENDERRSLTPMQEARQAAVLVRPVAEGGFGMSQKEAAAALSAGGVKKRGQPLVARRLAYVALVPELQDEIDAGTLPKAVAYELGSKLAEKPELQRAVWAEAKPKALDEVAVRVLCEQAAGLAEDRPRRGRKRTAVTRVVEGVVQRVRRDRVPLVQRPEVHSSITLSGALLARAHGEWGRYRTKAELSRRVTAMLEQEFARR